MKWVLLTLALSVSGLAQSSALLFDGVKLYYQRPGEKNFRDDRGVLALDGSQKVMLLLKDNRPLLILRQDSITSISFEEKKDKTLTIRYGGANEPSGSVRMELSGKWKDILEALRAQSGQTIQMIGKK
ncbi:MAG: hypothetical protein HY821_24425 [Acidobacteria bacterium]|nr:hypothetical protein [Acidobacteriota bacterium]